MKEFYIKVIPIKNKNYKDTPGGDDDMTDMTGLSSYTEGLFAAAAEIPTASQNVEKRGVK